MPSAATALQGDTVDLICWRVLGTTQGQVVEHTYALNPGLAALGTTLPEGTTLTLPDPPSAAAASLDTVNLWD